jgi:hypothetical protein
MDDRTDVDLVPEPSAEAEVALEPLGSAEKTPSERPRRTSQPDELDAPFDVESPLTPKPDLDEGTEPFALTRTSVKPSASSMESEATVVEPVETIDEALLATDEDDEVTRAKLDTAPRKPRTAPPPPPRHEEPVVGREAAAVEAAEERAPGAREEEEPGVFGWGLLLVLLAAVGFVGWRLVEGALTPAPPTEPEVAPAEPREATETPTPTPTKVPAAEAREQPTTDMLEFGRTLPFIDAGAQAVVGASQGMLVVEAPSSGPPPELFLRRATRETEGSPGQSLGRAPQSRVVEEGSYELTLRRGDETSYRFLYVRRGQTRVIPAD